MKRIQRQRTKGWRMPEGAIYVGRPSHFGNPFRPAPDDPRRVWPSQRLRRVEQFRTWLVKPRDSGWFGRESEQSRARLLGTLHLLRGHDLVCWCPLDQPCHADVLLELANQ